MEYILHCLAFILKKLHLNTIVFKILRPFFHRKIVVNEHTIEEANTFLEKMSHNSNNSSISLNSVKENPKYDLQVIVPAHNVELYINACLDSILSQKTKYSFQIIVVNNGSADNTRLLLEGYRNNDKVKIIDQIDKGSAGARNSALKEINARYITFVDSDDYLRENAFESLLSCAYETDSDIVEGGFVFFKDRSILSKYSHVDDSDVKYTTLYGFPWGKVYKSDLFRNVCFPEGHLYDDTMLAYLVFPKAVKVVLISQIVYCYRKNLNGVIRSSKRKIRAIDSFWIVERMLEDFRLLKLVKTKEVYLQTLQQIKLTDSRIRFLDGKIKKAIFILTVNMLQREFEYFKSNIYTWEVYENAIKGCDYGIYRLYGLLR